MPAGNGTGPMGMGSMTGRAAGYCAGNSGPGHMSTVAGGGRGQGQGRGGRGCRGFNGPRAGWGGNRGPMMPGVPFNATPTASQEIDALKGQSEYFENTLGGIRKRIEELEAEKKGS